MKNYLLSILVLLGSASSLVASAGCSDRSKKDSDPIVSSTPATRADAPVAVAASPATPAAEPATVVVPAPAPAPAPSSVVVVAPPANAPIAAPFTDIALALDNVTRATTASLAVPQESMDRLIDGQIASWKASGATNTTAADSKLTLARTDFAQKLRALSVATDETWRNAKSEAQDSLQNLRRAYGEYLAGPPKF